ncbi:hypothetical protein HYZ41_01310 [archaeon]|nr:hypothetical protein [archaeon]
MKGSNEFTGFLVIGLIVLAILLAVYGVPSDGTCGNYRCCGRNCNATVEPYYLEVIKSFYIPLFKAENVLQTDKVQLCERNIQNGLLFGNQKIEYQLDRTGVQSLYIKLSVFSTNKLGNLIVKANNQVIENKHFDVGDYIIPIPANLTTDKTKIEIAAESSYWKIWAPTVYTLGCTDITYTSFESGFSQFKFYLGEEYVNAEFAKIDAMFNQSTGTLIVELNGKTVWNGPTAGLQTITLSKSDLRLGDNIIAFRAAENSRFVGAANIVVVYLTQYPELINKTGTVSSVQPFIGIY